MKKLSLAVLLALSCTAQAGGFITLEGEYENIHGSTNDVRSLNIIPGAKLNNGVTLDLKTQLQSKKDDQTVSGNIEPRVRYDYKIGMTDFTVWGRAGIGEKIANGANFGYYTLEPGISYKATPDLNLFVSDRYRDAFADGKGYQTNTIYLGSSYKVTDVDSIGAKAYRKYGDTESNGFEVNYTRSF